MTLGVVRDIHRAKNTVQELQHVGYEKEELSVLVKDDRNAGLSKKGEHAVATGVTTGAVAGGVIGALGGLLIGFGMVTLPGVGPLLAGGPLLGMMGVTGAAASTTTSAVAGVVAGGAAGGIIGGLVKMGVDKKRAEEFQSHLKDGAALVVVATDRINREVAEQVLRAKDADLITYVA